VSIREPPLPWRERVGVRGIKMEGLDIPSHYHPHPCPPPSRGRENTEFPDENELMNLGNAAPD